MATNIPKARKILQEAITGDSAYDSGGMYSAIVHALEMMTRTPRPPRPSGHAKMTRRLGKLARHLHETTGLPQAAIARRLNVADGRVNEALNGKWI
jgi:hypothetical protein